MSAPVHATSQSLQCSCVRPERPVLDAAEEDEDVEADEEDALIEASFFLCF